MASSSLSNFLGGSPGRVILQLVILSLIVGFVLSYFELTPFDLLAFIKRSFISLWNSGLGTLRDFANWLVVGAVIVIPLFILARLFSSRR